MIDKIILHKKVLTVNEKENLINSSRLEKHHLNGLPYYDNRTTQNFTGGLYIKIDKTGTLKITGSLHKYSSFKTKGALTNYDSFSMKQAKQTILNLLNDLKLCITGIEVKYFEIGLNVKCAFDVSKIIDEIHCIYNNGKERIFYINPKHKGEREKITSLHRDFRQYFKVYDKVHEMKDKRHKVPINIEYVLRLETVHKRVEKTTLESFIIQLEALKERFFNEWDTLTFFKEIEAPKGTLQSKKELARLIIYNGKNTVLNDYRAKLENKTITKRQFYNIKSFIDEWENVKQNYSLKNRKVGFYWWDIYNETKAELHQ